MEEIGYFGKLCGKDGYLKCIAVKGFWAVEECKLLFYFSTVGCIFPSDSLIKILLNVFSNF